ncbi:MAG: hypothetical protein QOD06_2546 [Candidatus Binatota bacterium]|nr:hypothetical protein [Candidatus Binatota bacterium]
MRYRPKHRLKHRPKHHPKHQWIAALLFTAALLPRAAVAASPERPPPRLSLLDGEVSFWRPGGDWVKARTNTPLAAGDYLSTAEAANVEVQVGPRAFLRAGPSTTLALTSLDSDTVQLELTAGEASLDLRELAPGQTIELDTPSAAFTVDRPGYYRVNVDADASTLITRRGGTATAVPAGGRATPVSASEEVTIAGTESSAVDTYAAPEPDGWDRWNYARTDRLMDSLSARYLGPGIYGAADLDQAGRWRTLADYGPVWFPIEEAPGWAPYTTGEWIYDPAYQWTWVDDRPWGWAPFHHGRWVYAGSRWGWAPGPIVAAPVYAPATVGWIGDGTDLDWVALGWGEPLFPWWGPPGFVDVAWWGGWGGPRIVNERIVRERIIVERNVTFVNSRVGGAVVETRADRFARGDRDYRRASPDRVHEMHRVAHDHFARPTAAGLSPRSGSGRRPPEDVLARAVVARRAPHDPGLELRALGLHAEATHSRPRLAPAAARPVPESRPREGGLDERGRTRARGGDVGAEIVERRPPEPPPRFDEWWRHEAPQARDSSRSFPRDLFSPPSATEEREQSQPSHHALAGDPPERGLPGAPGMRVRPRGFGPERGRRS